MSKKIITIVLVLCIAGAAQASIVFDFEGVASPYDAAAINTYMNSVYPGTSVQDGVIHIDPGNNNWLKTGVKDGPPADLEIIFTDPICALTGKGDENDTGTVGYAFIDGYDTDFKLFAYGKDYGSVENPVDLVWSTSIDGRGVIYLPDVVFNEDVYLLRISNDYQYHVAIDNLTVCKCIPAPGAILLGSIGAGLVGWMRRRRTL